MGYTSSYDLYQRRNRKRTLMDRLVDHFELFLGIAGLVIVAGFIFLAFWMTNAWVNTTHGYHACMVTNKESVNKDKTHEYRVYTENCGVFTVKDEAWLGLYNSADTYAKIKTDKSYDFQTVGWRNGFFSSFENIVKVG
jgi:hypothetical protein